MDDTYILVGGHWKYLYRAVDKLGQTVDFLLTAHRDLAAARRFFGRAINLHGMPEKVTTDKSGANTVAVRGIIADSGAPIELRQSKYLNNLVEQDHRTVKRRVRAMMGFKEFHSAARLVSGIETHAAQRRVRQLNVHWNLSPVGLLRQSHETRGHPDDPLTRPQNRRTNTECTGRLGS
jgi:transposase-like protein